MNSNPNRLSQETSPYLLQHSHNPVDWYPWGEEALSKAVAENKLILISIGYSACHWCHVMEHESFEDESVAQIMNDFFVCIKIDREERPDIDQIYMTAVQLITGSGGWPLNCFCLPDQRPIYGGTYFKNADWKNVLLNLAGYWRDKPNEAVEYAVRLTEGIRNNEQLNFVEHQEEYSHQNLVEIIEPWKRQFDMAEGGYNRAPKFPLPNNWQFLLRYAHLANDNTIHVSVRLTLEKMAFGGIYDQIAGGFARYSVDDRWHVPHFEKMLYDNAQLVSVYSEAYQLCKDPIYKEVVFATLAWLKAEMTSHLGGFYSALDADSEGVEGKFYTYTRSELKDILGADEELFSIYFNVAESGNWPEEHTNIFFRKSDDKTLASQLGINEAELRETINRSKTKIASNRATRVRPGLDNKILAGWNGLMLKGLTDAYKAFTEPEFLAIAIRNASFILSNLRTETGDLIRSFNSSGSVKSAFLDDYASVIEGLIGLYEVTFDEKWLNEAATLTENALSNFLDKATGMFYYTSAGDEKLIARKYEITDNVIPSSNSIMAHNLYKLGHLFDNQRYIDISSRMLSNVFPKIRKYGSGHSNWASLLLNIVYGVNEIAITGPQFENRRKEMEQHFIPNKIILGGITGTLPLLAGKWDKETRVFVCKNKTCLVPVNTIAEALKQINQT